MNRKMTIPIERIMNLIWQHAESQPTLQLYAILDTAREERIYHKLADAEIECVSLFRGEKAHEMATVAPYLIALHRNDAFTSWLFNNGWGKSWSIIIESSVGFDDLKRHFRSFLMVYDDEGKPLYFRFYDPRVLRVYLPTCNESELKIIFGPVSHYWVEGEDGNFIIEYSQGDGELVEGVIQFEKNE
jgi:hypothetical protein